MVSFDPDRFLYGVLGDVHGDLPTLVEAVDAVRKCAAATMRRAFVFVLGDAIDRGPDSAGCATFLMRLARGEDKERGDAELCFVRGDHDEALSHDPATDRFASSVEPADWAERLNELSPDDPERTVARNFIAFVREAPAAALLSGASVGVLLAHGAVPHADLLPRLGRLADLETRECERDFVWCRVSSARRKMPNRCSLTCDVGREDVSDFLARLAELVARSRDEDSQDPRSMALDVARREWHVAHFIHGHEHMSSGWEATALRDGATAWTVTTFHDDDGGFLAPIRPGVVLIDRAERVPE